MSEGKAGIGCRLPREPAYVQRRHGRANWAFTRDKGLEQIELKEEYELTDWKLLGSLFDELADKAKA